MFKRFMLVMVIAAGFCVAVSATLQAQSSGDGAFGLVAEKSSVQLVESFFRHLKQGKNKVDALKLARDEIRKAGYDHPFFWAPFILVGEVN